jgi:hypothetical protein
VDFTACTVVHASVARIHMCNCGPGDSAGADINNKCTRGPHTEEFYKVEPDELSISDSPLNINRKRLGDALPESSGNMKRR